jgi:hypothetical protein
MRRTAPGKLDGCRYTAAAVVTSKRAGTRAAGSGYGGAQPAVGSKRGRGPAPQGGTGGAQPQD